MAGDALSIRDRVMKSLCEKKLLVENDIRKALEIQKEKGGKLSDILVGMGIVSRGDLVSAMSKELGIPPIDLSRYQVSPEVIKLVSKKVARNYRVVPISKMGNFLTIAIADPLNVFTTDDIASFTGCKISVVIASDKDITEAISQYYEAAAPEAIEQIIDEMSPQAGGIELLSDTEDTLSSAQLVKMIQEAPVVKVANMILAEGVGPGRAIS